MVTIQPQYNNIGTLYCDYYSNVTHDDDSVKTILDNLNTKPP